jgi:hypothetical protein
MGRDGGRGAECPKCGGGSLQRVPVNGPGGEASFELRCSACRSLVGAEPGPPGVGEIYAFAREAVDRLGYGEQVSRLESLLEDPPLTEMDAPQIFREYAWVVFTCGFRADVVRSKWGEVGEMLFGFEPARVRESTFEELLESSPIKNRQKVRALREASEVVTEEWVSELRGLGEPDQVRSRLRELPFVGEVTVWHLMRNLGVDCFKPDRHIVSLAGLLGREPAELFERLSDCGAERFTGVADYVLWRACASLGSARELVRRAERGDPPPEAGEDRRVDGLF